MKAGDGAATMNGRVVEIEYEKGWGRVQLDDGRTLSFDTAACREGIPERDARISVELKPSRTGGEKVALLRVEHSWEVLPEELPVLVTFRNMFLARAGSAQQAPPCGSDVACAPGDMGYATIQVRRGVVGHSKAWSGSAHRRPAMDERVSSLRKAALRDDELALFGAALRSELGDLWEDVYNPDSQESDFLEDHRRELQDTIELAIRCGVDTRDFLPPER